MQLDPETERRCMALAVTVNGVPVQKAIAPVAGDAPLLPSEMLSEKLFQARVTKYATEHGWTWHHHTISKMSKPGFLDLILIRDNLPGRLVVAELKVKGNVMTGAQKRWFQMWKYIRDAEVFLWTPEMWPSILEVLK